MVDLITPVEFLSKDSKKDSIKVKKNKESKSLFETYSSIKTPDIFKTESKDLNIDFEDNSARLYDKPKTDFFNDIRYGWNESQAGFFHLLANIPGGLDATKDFIGKAPGLGFLNGDGRLAGMESWLRKQAHANNPEALGLDAPDTLAGKILAGFAMTPITIATYVAPIRILKSVPMGMA